MEKFVTALGFFDCMHKGHRKLLETVASLAKELNAEPAVFTFDDDFFNAVFKRDKIIYTLRERLFLIEEMGIKKAIIGSPSKDFIELEGCDFLDYLDKSGVIGAVAGKDYRFGSGAEYGADDLIDWGRATGKDVIIEPTVLNSRGEKISSNTIRSLLADGKIDEANTLLGRAYFMLGEVAYGRGVGKKLGVPTANLGFAPERLLPKPGVYRTNTVVDGVSYPSVTNVGDCPTFGETKTTIETHLLNFSGEIYGKTIRIDFFSFLREIKDFGNAAALTEQINRDIQMAAEVDGND